MVDYETHQKRRNLVVGLFAFIGLLAFAWLIYKFGDLPTAVSEYKSYQVYVQFPEAQGIQKNTPVRFCGYQIGRVTAVMAPELLENLKTEKKYHQTKVVLSIDKKFRNIPSNVDIQVVQRGLGSSYIKFEEKPGEKLKPLDPNLPETKYLVDGILLQGSSDTGGGFFPKETQDKIDKLANNLNSLIENTNRIVGDPHNQSNIKKALEKLVKVSEDAESALEEFENFSVSGKKAVTEGKNEFNKTLVSVSQATEELNKTSAQLRVLFEKVNEGNGTASKIINDGRLYESLLESSDELKSLLSDIRKFVRKSEKEGIPMKLK